jgi:hypothetical protein
LYTKRSQAKKRSFCNKLPEADDWRHSAAGDALRLALRGRSRAPVAAKTKGWQNKLPALW